MSDYPIVQPATYVVEGGGTIIVEAEVPRGYQEQQVSFLSRRGETPKFGDAINHVMPALREAAERIRGLEFKPDEIELEVGVKFVGAAGVVIARASAEANLIIKLKWLPSKEKEAETKVTESAGRHATAVPH